MSIEDAAAELRSAIGSDGPIGVAVILGSGLGSLVERLEDPVEVALADLPGMPTPTVSGHHGSFVAGRLEGAPVLLQAGRYHLYEGHPPETVAAPVRIMSALGVETLVLTNAAGGIHPNAAPGDLVLLDDVLNLSFCAPLAGPVVGTELRFPDMSAPFDPSLQAIALEAARDLGMELLRGTYAGVLGPAYETAAEVRMLQRMGADVVGMSTVPEVVAAAAVGLRCVGISLVTNRATGLGAATTLSHEDVLEVGRIASERLGRIVTELVRRLGRGT